MPSSCQHHSVSTARRSGAVSAPRRMPRRSPRPSTCRYAAALAALAAVLVTVAAAPAATRPRVPVYFLQGEQLAHVNRPGASAADAVRQLLAGPTRAEVARGFRTYVPARS